MDFDKKDVRGDIVRITGNTDKKIHPFKNQDFERLKNECLRSGRLFEDPLFTPSDKSMFYTQPIPSGAKWKRPGEICSNPSFIVGKADANDLDQGYLGNCWFVAGCAGIVLVPELFENVCPSDQQCSGPKYAGIFHFRFWYYGTWVDVVIDDRLPVYPNGKLIFCSNREEPSEFWAALLEKAYAKLCGCYENLDGGSTTDALIDMSGGIQEQFEIKDMKKTDQKEEIWQILIKSRQHKSLIGCSIAPNPRIREARLQNGLVMGHAYTVTRVACIELYSRDYRLIRCRNPWGNEVEWRGAWSDSYYQWNSVSSDIKKALDYKNAPEGEFWMSYDDFYSNFETLQFCELTPDAFSSELLKKQDPKRTAQLTWKLTAYNGEWTPGVSSGGSGRNNDAKFWTNPQFLISLTDPDPGDDNKLCTIIISLLQKYTREKRTQNRGESCEEFIQFRIYRILNAKDANRAKSTGQKLYADSLERIGVSGSYINSREVTKRFTTVPGDYLIIPSCYDADIKGEFLLRFYTENPISEASVLNESKDSLTDREKFFSNAKNVDEMFDSWMNLMGGSDNNNNSQPFVKQRSNYVSTSLHTNVLKGYQLPTPFVIPSAVYDTPFHNTVFEKVDIRNIDKARRF